MKGAPTYAGLVLIPKVQGSHYLDHDVDHSDPLLHKEPTVCVYGMAELPLWIPRSEENAEYKATEVLPRWSGGKGLEQPPALGTRINASMNGFGQGVVVAYFVEHGWLGIEVAVDKRPDWHVKQTKASDTPDRFNPLLFGSEVEALPF